MRSPPELLECSPSSLGHHQKLIGDLEDNNRLCSQVRHNSSVRVLRWLGISRIHTENSLTVSSTALLHAELNLGRQCIMPQLTTICCPPHKGCSLFLGVCKTETRTSSEMSVAAGKTAIRCSVLLTAAVELDVPTSCTVVPYQYQNKRTLWN